MYKSNTHSTIKRLIAGPILGLTRHYFHTYKHLHVKENERKKKKRKRQQKHQGIKKL